MKNKLTLTPITSAAFAALLESHAGAVIVGVDTFTDARARKTGNPFSKVEKLSRFVGHTGIDYALAVNREIASEANGALPTFEAKPLPWGEWVMREDGTRSKKLITHKGEFYVAMTSTRKIRAKRKVKVQFYADGMPVDKADVAAWLPAPSTSNRQAEMGVAKGKQVERRTFKLSSFKRVRFNGKNYVVRDA